MARVLLLGGTAEARDLAVQLLAAGVDFESSLAGRVSRPRLPVGPVRIGGFGGVNGLREHLRQTGVTAVVDATHPFAEGMTRNAAAACQAEGVPLLRLERPGWAEQPGASDWHWVADHRGAAQKAALLGRRPLLTVGRQALHEFVGPLAEHHVLARVVDLPALEPPDRWTIVTSRGPYLLEGELALIDEHGVDVLVTKDSGGSYTWAKMEAAAQRGLPVVVVRRNDPAPAVATVTDPGEVLDWLLSRDSFS